MAKIKRTYPLEAELVERLERAAKDERRPISEQLSIFLEEALEKYEHTKKPTNKRPATQETAPITA
jgi:hypothetical protein